MERVQTYCLLIIDIMKNEHMSYHLQLLSSLEVSMRGRGEFVIGRNMIRQLNVWIQIDDADFFLVIKTSKQVFSLPGCPLLLLFSSSHSLLVDSLSFSLSLPDFLPLPLLLSPSFLQPASGFLEWGCHCYSWFRSNNHALVSSDVSSIYILGLP